MKKIGIVFILFFIMSCSGIPPKPKIYYDDFESMDEAEIVSQKSVEQMNSLNKKDHDCVHKFVKNYQKSVLDYCIATDGGNGVGGGCAHIALGWSVALTRKAFSECGISTRF